jgi:small subunit ribosomal protein S17
MKVMQGTVQSAKTAQTAIVTVVNRWQHPLYKKFVKHSKNYACHLEGGMKVTAGQIVTIEECRPISKTKHFKVTAILEDAKLTRTQEDAPAKKAAEQKEVKTKEVKVEKPAKKAAVKKKK